MCCFSDVPPYFGSMFTSLFVRSELTSGSVTAIASAAVCVVETSLFLLLLCLAETAF